MGTGGAGEYCTPTWEGGRAKGGMGLVGENYTHLGRRMSNGEGVQE